MISTMCTEEVQAVLLALGTYFPNMLLAGMVWPLEGEQLIGRETCEFILCNLYYLMFFRHSYISAVRRTGKCLHRFTYLMILLNTP